ncbi:rod shape-determining protein MreC [Paenilisteria rocourtiae]|uniref:Cell shape-determining protein MreC n=1 Tax=Listeria rocourtiae TaxID=647910 RepID=A0A4R6ZM85_9LIST|nr:rod shape-determining protein MreC [Listeria rocourtiae]MBC1434424.1 rod shape-determining protein MreC [Listeria rocourtiae]MBC1603916.1 rod shape-determining protein MreC [Listeria rocourtiae]TDR53577.1 rod shape-determining protein MreC [Listeria rocourtiae]
MPQFFLNKRLIILLISIIVLVALVGYSLSGKSKASWPEQFVKDVAGFGENIVSKPAGFVASFFDSAKDLKNTYTENEHLKKRLEELAQLESKVSDLTKENAALKKSLDIEADLSDYEPINATVISRNPDNWNTQVQIDKGSVDGVKPNMAVRTPEGMIGKVTKTGAKSSTVKLLSSTDDRNRISAIVQGKSSAYGIINGYDAEQRLLEMKQLPVDQKFTKGEKVVTSGLGGIFPSDIFIGTIEKVETDKMGLSQTALVKPGADLYDLSHVIVLKRTLDGDDSEGTGS